MLAPPFLEPGSTVMVVAPSSPFPADTFQRGLALLRNRYQVRVHRDLTDVSGDHLGYHAGADQRRLDELSDSLMSEDICAIIAARGGVGATRIIHQAPMDQLLVRPRWIVGFSDVTALHVEAQRVGIQSIHGNMVTGLGRNPGSADQLFALLEGHSDPTFRALPSVGLFHPSPSEGVSFGGNLALLAASAASGRLRPPARAIWFIEDCNERPYRVDRMLTSLKVGGYFNDAAGFVFGQFDGCDPGPDGVTVQRVVGELLGQSGLPVALDAPFGHGVINEAFRLGARCRLEPDTDTNRPENTLNGGPDDKIKLLRLVFS